MALFRISGVWKTDGGEVTAYAVHEVMLGGTSRSIRMLKSQLISLLETPGNSATTWVWNIHTASWRIDRPVEVVDGPAGKYLRALPDNSKTDNLKHLMDYDWIWL